MRYENEITFINWALIFPTLYIVFSVYIVAQCVLADIYI